MLCKKVVGGKWRHSEKQGGARSGRASAIERNRRTGRAPHLFLGWEEGEEGQQSLPSGDATSVSRTGRGKEQPRGSVNKTRPGTRGARSKGVKKSGERKAYWEAKTGGEKTLVRGLGYAVRDRGPSGALKRGKVKEITASPN